MQAARGTPLTSSEAAGPPDLPAPRRRLALFAAVALTAYAADVLTKIWAVHALSDRAPVPVVGDLLQLTLVRNPGAAFSTGTGYTWIFSLLAITAVVVVLVVARRVRSAGWAVALGLLMAGVAGNLTDRIVREPGVLHGHVIDFLALPSWPVFNLADVCINVAAGLIILQAFRGVAVDGSRHARRRDDEQPEGEVHA
jgi:signal peptidase II